MVRLGAPGKTRLRQATSLDVGFAGAEANVAVSLAQYGMESEYITCLPYHPLADQCVERLRGYGVGVNNIFRGEGRMGTMYLETGSDVRPSRVYYDREHSLIADGCEGVFDWERILAGVDWFHWTGITPALSAKAAAECKRAIEVARHLGVKVSCDVNYRSALWRYGLQASEVMPEMAEMCDMLIGNEEDFGKVFGITVEGFDAEHTGSSIEQGRFEEVCRRMVERFPQCQQIATTLRGANGADSNSWGGVLYTGGRFYQSTRYEIDHIVDRVGSGDSFAAGLIYGLSVFENPQHILDFAVAASCLKHTIKGDFNLVSVGEVESLMRGNSSGRVVR